jgi:hypothetical protein
MAITNNNWLNANSTRRYPLDDKATGEADDGAEFPHDIIVDMRLRFPELTAKFAAVSSVNCTGKIVTVTISGCNNYTLSTDEADPVSQFTPLAVVSLPKPVISGVPYAVRPVANGVYGWIVFGEGTERRISARFSKVSQALLAPRAALSYKSEGVRSISTNDASVALTKDVLLRAVGDLDISYGTRNVQGIGEVNAIVFRLSNQSSSANLFEKYIGKCQGRPESESCKKISVEYLNNIRPDCFGNINLSFISNQISAKRIISTQITGLAVEIPLGMAEVCTQNDYLPDQNGKLPNEYTDVCQAIADAAGDQDAIAETSNAVTDNPSLSSSVLESTLLPYLDALDKPVGSEEAPRHFEFINSTYFYKDTTFHRGFPAGPDSNGLAVYNTGSRFAAVWNDPSNDSHVYQRDYPPASTTGNRASISFAFAPSTTTGTAGVILDYCTVYSESCNKYIKAYIIGVFNLSSKRLEVYRWAGLSWILVAKSPPISGLAGGTWYTIDFQKDINQTSGTKVQYRLNIFYAADYWSTLIPIPISSSSSSEVWPGLQNSSSSSEVWPGLQNSSSSSAGPVSSSESYVEVNETPLPAAGYSVSIADISLGELSLYSESNGLTDCLTGFGTVNNGAITFSYFFVG